MMDMRRDRLRQFSSAELANLRRTQNASMMDRCSIQHASAPGAKNAFGNPSTTYGDPVTSICGYQPSATNEVQIGNETVIANAIIRLPLAAHPTALDRITVTHIKGEAVNPVLNFEVVGQPAQGPTGFVVGVQRITY